MKFESLVALHPDVSRETFDALTRYAEMLRKWNRAINLVAPDTLPELWLRHMLDSLQIWPLIPKDARHLMDFGSGAGFPGLALAIAAHGSGHPVQVTLVDSDQRKCEFLRTVSRDLSLDTIVIADRVEQVPPQSCDVVTARALSSLDTLLGFALLHLSSEGTALFLKGATAEHEIAAAREEWVFACESLPSQTNPQSRVLVIRDIRRV